MIKKCYTVLVETILLSFLPWVNIDDVSVSEEVTVWQRKVSAYLILIDLFGVFLCKTEINANILVCYDRL